MNWNVPVLVLIAGVCALPGLRAVRQYHYAKETVNWREAQSLCRDLHSDLATVTSTEEAKRLVEVSHGSIGGLGGKTWIGLRDDLNKWMWSNPHDGNLRPSVYNNWTKAQPDNFNGNQLCVKMVGDGGWNDNSCAELLPFVCYNGLHFIEAPRNVVILDILFLFPATAVQKFVRVVERLNWLEAQSYCRKFHTDLVTIKSETDNVKVRSINDGKDVWIGLNRTRQWSDGSDSLFRLWKAKQPDNAKGIQQCTVVDLGSEEGLWSDEDCTLKLPYVCLRDNVHVVDLQVKLTSTMTLTENELAVLVEREIDLAMDVPLCTK
ncbi:C-type mannose receptor 2-like isoform X2 [Dunckerocampus dactyliophorus]|uniref:C-type mannose receptor 2-like isoform X2 n=1 Tax=Dunckerocampus dactyliophorus TaxID=161453 RepID=UPI00240753BF|nr:C-type mannose receptor 2-like isoform X2 [Dunckerocampus dactyliophorus]